MDVDTSSYPKATQSNFLDIASKLQGLEQQKIGIDQNKLKLVNDRWGNINRELATMASDPNVTPAAVSERMQNLVNLGLVPADMSAQFIKTLPAQPGPQLQQALKTAILRGNDNVAAMNFHFGQTGLMDTVQGLQPIISSPNPEIGIRSIGLPIQKQNSPSQPTVDNDPNSPTYGQPKVLGPQPLRAAPGSVIMPPPAPGFKLPVQPQARMTDTIVPNNRVVQNRFSMPVAQNSNGGPVTGMPPMYEEGKKAYNEDQLNATAKAQGIQPVIQALDIMKTPGFNSGPGTAAFNNAMAALKTWGIIDIAGEKDPTVGYQQVIKKLNDYVSRSPVGQRSDAAQTLKEASSPNPKVQLLPALIKLSEDAVALDRMEIARPRAFKGANYTEYPNHRSGFPANMDYRAFKLDQMGEDGQKLVDQMEAKIKKNPKDREAVKFFKSLDIAKDQYQ